MAKTTITVSTEFNEKADRLKELARADKGTKVSKEEALLEAMNTDIKRLEKKLVK